MSLRVSLFFIACLFLRSAPAEPLDTVRIQHKRYTTWYDKSRHYPVLVHWQVSPQDLDCDIKVKRKSRFTADPFLGEDFNADYKHSGYDKGHQMPAADCKCDEQAMQESFYFSNISPQLPPLNRRTWADLEGDTRTWAQQGNVVDVFCGCVGESKSIGRVFVPTLCWKVLWVSSSATPLAFVFPNEKEVDKQPYKSYQVTLDSVLHLAPYIRSFVLRKKN